MHILERILWHVNRCDRHIKIFIKIFVMLRDKRVQGSEALALHVTDFSSILSTTDVTPRTAMNDP